MGISAGLPAGVAQTEYGVTEFAIDDYVLLLALEEVVYEAVSEFKDLPFALARKKLSEVITLVRNNGIAIKHTKRLLHLLRAVTGFRAAPATFVEQASRLLAPTAADPGKP